MGREDSDEAYVLDLCDDALGERGLRQHRFDWLLGDPGSSGRRARLPVDAYWPGQGLVVEYRERQHDQPVAFFDKPDRLTVSGVHRGEQRALYDSRRDTLIPANGLRLVVIGPADLAADSRGRLRRHRDDDLHAIRRILATSAADPDAPRPCAGQSAPHPESPSAVRVSGRAAGNGLDEPTVVGVFRRWLTAQGWTVVQPRDGHADIEAVRGGERLIGEAKGTTAAPGTDLDTAYGQLLRRMTGTGPGTRYALVVPTAAEWHVARVPAAVRKLLAIDVYVVSEEEEVFRISD